MGLLQLQNTNVLKHFTVVQHNYPLPRQLIWPVQKVITWVKGCCAGKQEKSLYDYAYQLKYCVIDYQHFLLVSSSKLMTPDSGVWVRLLLLWLDCKKFVAMYCVRFAWRYQFKFCVLDFQHFVLVCRKNSRLQTPEYKFIHIFYFIEYRLHTICCNVYSGVRLVWQKRFTKCVLVYLLKRKGEGRALLMENRKG